MDCLLVATHGRRTAARATVRSWWLSAGDDKTSKCHVLRICECYEPVGPEQVLSVADLGVTQGQVWAVATAGHRGDVARWLLARLAVHVVSQRRAAVAVRPGVEICGPLEYLEDQVGTSPLGLFSRGADLQVEAPSDRSWTVHDPELAVFTADGERQARIWARLTSSAAHGARAIDTLGGVVEHVTFRDGAALLSPSGVAEDVPITLAGGHLTVSGRRATLVDLSRADERRPWLIDAKSPHPTLLLSDHPALAGWVRDALARRQQDTAEMGTPRQHLDPLTTTSRGTPFNAALRLLVGEASGVSQPTPDPRAPSPFDPDQRTAWEGWLLESVPSFDLPRVPRLLDGLHRSRVDLQRAFPCVPGGSSAAFLDWVGRHGVLEFDDPELLRAAVDVSRGPDPAGPRASQRRLLPGVNLVGYLRGELGIGQSARLIREALQAAEIPHSVIATATQLGSRQRAEVATTDNGLDRETTLLCVNAAQLGAVSAELGQSLGRTRRIGYWYWEVEVFPPGDRSAFELVDEVWVATDFVRDAIAAVSPVSVHTVPPPLEFGTAPSHLGRADLGLPADRFIALFVFDYLSNAERKNPWGAVAAFRHAFPPSRRRPGGPLLVIKTINADQKTGDAERLRLLVAEDPDIVLIEHYLDTPLLRTLMASCDVYLSLHRSEGLGLTMAEAMSRGKPVIATAYSGNLAFMDDRTAFLVPWSPLPVPEGCAPYPAGTPWADPDVEAAAAFLVEAVENPSWAIEVGRRGATGLQARFSAETCGRGMKTRLDTVRRSRRWSVRRG